LKVWKAQPQSRFEIDLRLPAEQIFRLRYIWTSLFRIILGQRLESQAAY
jgi:hypothetical protein